MVVVDRSAGGPKHPNRATLHRRNPLVVVEVVVLVVVLMPRVLVLVLAPRVVALSVVF